MIDYGVKFEAVHFFVVQLLIQRRHISLTTFIELTSWEVDLVVVDLVGGWSGGS